MKTPQKLVSLLLVLCMLLGMGGIALAANYVGDIVIPGLSGILPEDSLTLPENTFWATLTAKWGVRVIFLDWDETELKTELVPVTDTEPGSSHAPEDPTRDGYVFMGWERYDTNDGPATLNDDGSVTDVNGPGPIVYIATYAKANEVFYVVHHAVHGDLEDTVDPIPMSAVDEDGYFDITEPLTGKNAKYYDGVREGYLYGGMYVGGHDSEAYETEPEKGLCGKELEPEAGKYYYMREVSEEFLQPRILSVRRYRLDTHVERYLITALDKDGADNGFYTTYGFSYNVNAEDFDSYLSDGVIGTDETEEIYDESVDETPYEEYAPMQCLLYEYIDIYDKDVLVNTYKPGNVFSDRVGFEYITNDDYFGCIPYDANFADAGTMETEKGKFDYNFHYTPYYVTADGVFVSGIYERYTDISKAETAATNSDFKLKDGSVTYSYSNAPVLGMTFASCFMANPDLMPAPEIVPETDKVTVTIHADGETSVVSAEPGDFTSLMEAPELVGRRFVGWYADEDYTVPADFSDIAEDTDVYARYIDDAYFTVEMISTISKRKITKTRVITVVDDRDNYQEVGLEITVGGEKTVYALNKDYASVNGYSPVKMYGDSVDKHSRMIYQDVKLNGLADGTEIEIIPYYVTVDGSRIYGKSRSVIYCVSYILVA